MKKQEEELKEELAYGDHSPKVMNFDNYAQGLQHYGRRLISDLEVKIKDGVWYISGGGLSIQADVDCFFDQKEIHDQGKELLVALIRQFISPDVADAGEEEIETPTHRYFIDYERKNGIFYFKGIRKEAV